MPIVPLNRIFHFLPDLAYLDSTSNQVVYANNFFSGQSGNCDQQVAHENTAANGNDPNYQSANLYGGLWSGTCGTSNLFSSSTSGGTDRIVGGNETAEHQYPWMVRKMPKFNILKPIFEGTIFFNKEEFDKTFSRNMSLEITT